MTSPPSNRDVYRAKLGVLLNSIAELQDENLRLKSKLNWYRRQLHTLRSICATGTLYQSKVLTLFSRINPSE